ncbi:hypothetical protein [Beijerinckia sp. L45]|uniref:hypothetical protein n=1 Tax=Beijerinckia sp. L45 TaxID=1641855 RepID=UPI00131E7FED|nr:hypothetical protein [Beijerinckia sp. L45]
MPAIFPEYRKLVQVALTIAAALLVLAAMHFPARAETDRHMIVIPASDGYGFDDCLSGNKACGKVIADAWCEAHGMAVAQSYGRADDVTASAVGVATPKLDPGSFIVTCSETVKP